MGFLGYNLACFFSKAGYTVYGIGHHQDAYLSSDIIFKKWKTASISFNELQNMGIKQLDYVFHCGGSGTVGSSFLNPSLDYHKTVNGTHQICEYLRLYHPNAHLIYPSSVAVIGNINKKRITEDDRGNPISPYGYHKKIAEQICEEYAKIFGIKTSIIRLFSVYGIGLKKQFLWDCIQKIKNGFSKKQINLLGTGEEIRDYIHIWDVIQIFAGAIKQQKTILEYYNGGSGEGQNIKDIASQIASILNFDGEIIFEKTNHQGDPKCYLADTKKLSQTLNFKPQQKFLEQLEKYISWAKDQ